MYTINRLTPFPPHPTQLLHRPRAANRLVRLRARQALAHCALLARPLTAADPPTFDNTTHDAAAASSCDINNSEGGGLHSALAQHLVQACLWELEMATFYHASGALRLSPVRIASYMYISHTCLYLFYHASGALVCACV